MENKTKEKKKNTISMKLYYGSGHANRSLVVVYIINTVFIETKTLTHGRWLLEKMIALC